MLLNCLLNFQDILFKLFCVFWSIRSQLHDQRFALLLVLMALRHILGEFLHSVFQRFHLVLILNAVFIHWKVLLNFLQIWLLLVWTSRKYSISFIKITLKCDAIEISDTVVLHGNKFCSLGIIGNKSCSKNLTNGFRVFIIILKKFLSQHDFAISQLLKLLNFVLSNNVSRYFV